MAKVYEPAEDSFLLLRHVERLVQGSVLDVGTGSGIQAVAAAAKPDVERVVAVDISPEAIEAAQRRAAEAGVSERVKFRVGDLLTGLADELFDWIVFNPPYLPSEGEADEGSWAGGVAGSETILRFLAEAPRNLRRGGNILLVYSTLTGFDLREIGKSYHVEFLEELPMFFETLFCVLLRPLSPS
jgi:release factor glutamine methyltransferase